MKKLTLLLGLALGLNLSVFANKYKLNDAALNQMIEQSQEIIIDESNAADFSLTNTVDMQLSKADTKTRGGFLLRSFFCGGIALHRYYMGTAKKHMWALYFCVPVAGGVAACVDFWGSVFDKDFHQKFANNDKWFVWLD